MAKSKATEKSVSPSSKVATVINFVKPFTDCPSFYSNIGQVSTSANDVRLVLCHALEQVSDGVDVNPQAVVYMPHEHAKRLADIILVQLEKAGFLSKTHS